MADRLTFRQADACALPFPDISLCIADFVVADSMAQLTTVLEEGAVTGVISAQDAEIIRASWKTAQCDGTFFAMENIVVVCGTKPE